MIIGYIILAVSYVFVISLSLWLLARKNAGYMRIIAVPLLIFYSVVVYATSDTVLGYPSRAVMQDSTVIVGIRIVEPNDSCEGGLYFWGVPIERILDETSIPRSYGMPYDRELHKQLMSKKKGEGQERNLMVWRTKKQSKAAELLSSFGLQSKDYTQGKFEILNPAKILAK